MAIVVNFNQSPLSPVISPMHLFKTKKGEKFVFVSFGVFMGVS